MESQKSSIKKDGSIKSNIQFRSAHALVKQYQMRREHVLATCAFGRKKGAEKKNKLQATKKRPISEDGGQRKMPMKNNKTTNEDEGQSKMPKENMTINEDNGTKKKKTRGPTQLKHIHDMEGQIELSWYSGKPIEPTRENVQQLSYFLATLGRNFKWVTLLYTN
ncbi:hypothetical protein PIB30_072887 [Stylosanthes scabra]|uniref:Uncharacterized protein n=1 Tax=Stylosanthes scabra TaxID=79078 RepID=A0ABU6WSL3_9FABA|nr:hypothetical protein [Stylosanthes scabra]